MRTDKTGADKMPGRKRKKYIGVGGDAVPSLGVLESEILRILWDAGESQSSVQVYDKMYRARLEDEREMQSPSTIAVTLSRMVEKGLLTVERRPNSGKGYYGPTRTRADVVTRVLDDVCRRLTGETLGGLLVHVRETGSAAADKNGRVRNGIEDLIVALRHLDANAAEKP